MKSLPDLASIRTTKAYDGFLKLLYMGVKPEVEEIEIPPVQAIAVMGNEPPSSKQYADAIMALYGIAYTLKMGLKFAKIPKPEGYFDYKVGALETFWWSVKGPVDVKNPATLRWQAYLMVPPFVTRALFEEARKQAAAKRPDTPYDLASLVTIDEGRSAQLLHVGPYDQEQPSIERLHAYVAEHGLAVNGRHHEIYLSDPRRTAPAKLKTVIRTAVKPAPREQRKRAK